jgi:D-aminopeptidase
MCLLGMPVLAADPAPRARDLGILFDGEPGALNAITDVAGVEVGHHTLIHDLADGAAVRTGVTAILPRGKATSERPVFAGWFALNGNGEMTGTTWVEESGFLEGPVLITNTHSVGAVHEAAIRWRVEQGRPDDSGYWWSLPVVAETWDGFLNDINGFHVRAEHVFSALRDAKSGPVAEGNVGGGTGMICHEFKCGIGTASRRVRVQDGDFMMGVLVQANYGLRDTLRVAGVPVGQFLTENRAYAALPGGPRAMGSIIIVVATDAPFLPHQLKRIVKRAALGLARDGGIASNGSGDIFIAFSTANDAATQSGAVADVRMLANDNMSPFFQATVEATEEAIINALVAGRTMTGNDGNTVHAIDHKALQHVLAEHNRLLPVSN